MKIAIVSLGCPKNQVDADVFCRALIEDGHHTVHDVALADIIIINTCGFIQSAKEEAIENILEACRHKKNNPAIKVVVTGCLAQRYQNEILDEIPEVDAVVGIGDNNNLPTIIQQLLTSNATNTPQQQYPPKTNLPLGGPRVISTPMHYAWLKIAEGCDNACAYCAIPQIRGPLRSRPLEDCVAEAKWLAQQGVRELVLVAQDVTAYGDDKNENQIAPLLSALNAIDGIHWIRLLYTYPERINDDFLDAIQQNPKVLPYFDIPIQHINDEILSTMKRRGNGNTIKNAVELIRRRFPAATLRTTLIAGFPGETEQQFEELCSFVKQTAFDRLGCFAFSAEEGTLAETLPNQLPQEVREQRADIIMKMQSHIMAEKQQQHIGAQIEVLCDEYDECEGCWLCRSKSDAPEIDVNVILDGNLPLVPGNFYKVTINDADECDLYANNAQKIET